MNSKEALKDLREVKGWNDVEFNKRLDIIEKALKQAEKDKIGKENNIKEGLERYRVKVVEKVSNYKYVVIKHNYEICGIFYLTTEKRLKLNEIVYVIVMPDGYRCRLFSGYMEEK